MMNFLVVCNQKFVCGLWFLYFISIESSYVTSRKIIFYDGLNCYISYYWLVFICYLWILKSLGNRTKKKKRRSGGEIQVSNQFVSSNASSGKKALIVEDVELTTKIIVNSLQRCGYVCEVAHDGQEAVQKALSERFYVILMDVWVRVFFLCISW